MGARAPRLRAMAALAAVITMLVAGCGTSAGLSAQPITLAQLESLSVSFGDGHVVRLHDGHAQIDIIDTGKGIPPEAIDKIFQAYYTSKKGGTGLGLAMAQRIAKEHGGQLTVKSEPGKGSNFTLRLPLA